MILIACFCNKYRPILVVGTYLGNEEMFTELPTTLYSGIRRLSYHPPFSRQKSGYTYKQGSCIVEVALRTNSMRSLFLYARCLVEPCRNSSDLCMRLSPRCTTRNSPYCTLNGEDSTRTPSIRYSIPDPDAVCTLKLVACPCPCQGIHPQRGRLDLQMDFPLVDGPWRWTDYYL